MTYKNMNVTVPFVTKLSKPILAADTSVPVQGDPVVADSDPASRFHYTGLIYTAQHSEAVLVVGYMTEGAGYRFQIGRAFGGTTPARNWPAGACLRLTEKLLGEVVADAATGTVTTPKTTTLWDELTVGPGLRINRDDPNNPFIELAPTGVVPGTVGGAVVNKYGQLVSYPAGWPQSAVADFNQCC